MKNILIQKIFIITLVIFASCAAKKPMIMHTGGPVIINREVAVYLASSLNTAVEAGPVSFKLAHEITLGDNKHIPKDSILEGFFVTDGNKVTFAPAFAYIKAGTTEEKIALNSIQVGRLAVTPTTARYMKEMGKGAAIGGTIGVLGGAIAGAKYGVGGAVVGAVIGGAIGGSVGAGSQALGLWLKGDEPVTLPEGSGIVISFANEE